MYSTKYSAIFYLTAGAASSAYVALRSIPSSETCGTIFSFLVAVLLITLTGRALPYRTGPLSFLHKWRRLYRREERERQLRKLEEWQARDIEKQQKEADTERCSDITNAREKSQGKFLTLTAAPTVQAVEDDGEVDTWMGVSLARWGLNMRPIYFGVMALHVLCLGTFAELLGTSGGRRAGGENGGDAISAVLDMLPQGDGTELGTVDLVRIWITHFSLVFLIVGVIESIRQNKRYIQPSIGEMCGPRLNQDDYGLSLCWIGLSAYSTYFSVTTIYGLAVFVDIIVGKIFLGASAGSIGIVAPSLSSIWSTHNEVPNLGMVFDLSSSWPNILVILPLAFMATMDAVEKIFYFLHKPFLSKRLFEPGKKDWSVCCELIPEDERGMLVRPRRECTFLLDGVPIVRIYILWSTLASFSYLLSRWSEA